MFKKKTATKVVAVPSSPGVAAVPGSRIPVSQEELTLANSEFNVHKITDIQNRFHGGSELLVAGRIFVREGTLVKVCRKGPKPRQFFLFNDILIYGTILPTKGRYAAQHIMDLEHMTVTSDCHFMPSVYTAHSTELDVDSENAFQVNHMDKSFHVFASSLADKANWIHNLKKYIGKRTAGKHDQTNYAMKAVWVPDARVNHCMGCDCKFTTFNRKHHCRFCGKVVCNDCSPHRVDVSGLRGAVKMTGKMERVCKECFQLSQADPHKGKSPPTSPTSSPRGSRTKLTVIDSRTKPSPEPPSVLAQAGFIGSRDSPSPDDTKAKRPAPARPPPPSSDPPTELVQKARDRRQINRIDSGTFDRPRSKAEPRGLADDNGAVAEEDDDDLGMEDDAVAREGSSDSSDSDDSAEIDLDDVEEADPFTMQRANSESPLHGSLTDEGLGEMCQKIQSTIRLSAIDVMATDDELHDIMLQSVAGTLDGVIADCSECRKSCGTGQYGKLREKFLCEEHFYSTVRTLQQVDTTSATMPAATHGAPSIEPRAAERAAPSRPARKADSSPSPEGNQPMKPKPRQRMATATEKAGGTANKDAEATSPEGATTAAAVDTQDVDQMLTMTPEERTPTSAATMLVSLATDPPGLSSQPLVPVPAPPTEKTPPAAKRHTERRKKKFQSSAQTTSSTASTAATDDQKKAADAGDAATPAEPAPVQEMPEKAESAVREETDSVNELVDLSQAPPPANGAPPTSQSPATSPAAAAATAASGGASPTTPVSGSGVVTGDLLDFGPAGEEEANTRQSDAAGKALSRAEKRKNKFKKKDAV